MRSARLMCLLKVVVNTVGGEGIMDYFHLEAKVISRGSGRSVMAAAAYASCSRLYNDYDGITHDYTRKQGCLYSEVFLPTYAPIEWKDRQLLWEAVEQIEKAKDSRLARELIVALPIELSIEHWKIMLQKFIQEQGTNLGMCADVSIHDTDGHNPHAHILLTVRPLDEKGQWQAKTQKEYICRFGTEEKGFTAEEFKVAKTQGWEKQYLYQFGKKKEYFTPSESEKIEGCIRTSKTPKSSRYGRQNPISAFWNSEQQLMAWRKSWEIIINEEQERNGIASRVDCRSYATQGLKQQPTIHEGYQARNMEMVGMISERCELNRQIKADNKILYQRKEQVEELLEKVNENIISVANGLENLRNHIVLLQYQLLFNDSWKENLISQKNSLSNVLDEYHDVKEKIKEKTTEHNRLLVEKKACGIHFLRANKIGEQLVTLTEEIEELKSQKVQVLAKLDCQESEIKIRIKRLKDIESFLEKLEKQSVQLLEQKEEAKVQFFEMKEKISEVNEELVQKERTAIRFNSRDKLVKKLWDVYGNRYSRDIFAKANQLLDKELKEQPIKERKCFFETELLKQQSASQIKKRKIKEFER